MIVEMCGPPGVGKTALAVALTERLRARRLGVELAASYRPAEQAVAPAPRGGVADAAFRIARPARELIANGRHLAGDAPEAAIARVLLRALPPRSLLWSVRLRQYIWRFARVWFAAVGDDRIWIFDQAFVQVIGSLVLLGRPAGDACILGMLAKVPRPDLLIRLDAPDGVLRSRLVEREHRQRRIERLLELDLETNLGFVGVLDRVVGLARRDGAAPVRVASDGPHSLALALAPLEQEVLARLAARRQAA